MSVSGFCSRDVLLCHTYVCFSDPYLCECDGGTARQCSGAVKYNILYTVLDCRAVQYSVVHYSIVEQQCITVQYSEVQYSTK